MRPMIVLPLLAACHFTAGNRPSNEDAAIIDDAPPGDVDFDAVTPDVGPDATPQPIPIVLVQSNTSQANSTAAVVAVVTYPLAQTNGNLNVVTVSWLGGATIATITDVAGNNYTSLGASSNSSVSMSTYYAENIRAALAATNVVTVTFATPSNSPTLRVVEYSGIVTTTALDNKATSAGSSATAAATVVTAHAHDVIYAAETSNHPATGPGAMFTQRILFSGDLTEDREVFATGSYAATVPLDQSATWIMLSAAFKGAQ